MAAGSLRLPFSGPHGVFADWQPEPEFRFGASGTVADEILTGAVWDIFCAANTAHPDRLYQIGIGTQTRVFATNALALLVRRSRLAGDRDPVAILRDPLCRIGMSTPKADPSGDYAEILLTLLADHFPAEAGAQRQRMKIVTGGGEAEPILSPHGVYAGAIENGIVDVMLAYRTVCQDACSRVPGLTYLSFPPPFAVGARFGATARRESGTVGTALLDYLIGDIAQQRLAGFGFGPPHQEGGV